jgi:hypothetical protein
MSFSTRGTGIAPIMDIGIDPKLTMGSGFTSPPRASLEPSSMCHPIFVMFPRDTVTSRIKMFERTGRHGKRISTGKGMEARNGTERQNGIMTVPTPIEGEAGTAIKPIE